MSKPFWLPASPTWMPGAHLLGPEYGELINTLGLAIKLGLTTRQLKSATAAYPTIGSDFGSML